MTLTIHDKPPKKSMFQAIKDEARNAVIEECAQFVEKSYSYGRYDLPQTIANAIRALKDKP